MKNPSEHTENRTSPVDESEATRQQPVKRLPGADDQDDLEFVVTEAHDDNPDMLGGFKPSRQPDDLGIQSNADLMDREAEQGRSAGSHIDTEQAEFRPIGNEFPDTPQPAEPQTPPETDFSSVRDAAADIAPADNASRIEKLSSEQVEEISRRMRNSSEPKDYLTEDEKLKLLSDLDRADGSAAALAGRAFDNAPIVPPKKTVRIDQAQHLTPEHETASDGASPVHEEHQPKMARRVRGIAFFTRSFIQVTGGQELHEDDELMIGGREYVLRKKKLSTKLVLSVGIPILALAIFAIAAFFSSNANTGEGQIVGLVLDESLQPFITGAEIRLPDLRRSVQTNGQGFFKTGPIPAGTQKIEYVMAGAVVAVDYATVGDGEVTTITLRPAETAATPAASQQATTPETQPQQVLASVGGSESSKTDRPAAGTTSKAQPTSESAKLKLSANVEGARITLDGAVLGAGNLTFGKLASGTHNYTISKDGYVSAEGTVTLTAGKTKTLTVVLESLPAAQTQSAPSGNDLYTAGLEKARQNNLEGALADFTAAIKLQPSHGDAHLQRAKALKSLSRRQDALDDFVRAAEIFRFSKRFNEAITAYNFALEIDQRSIAAYLGRASLYLGQKQDIAAIADYDMVIQLDKRNVQAYLGLGEARYNQGYYDKAIKHFKDARSIDPENPLIHQYLMLAYMGKGDTKEVKKSYDKYVKCATAEEAQRLKTDPQFGAVMRVVEER